MAGVESRSEFEGGGLMPNTVFPKGTDALTASDKLRLQSITGQEEDSHAQVNPYHWYGNTVPDATLERQQKMTKNQERRVRQRSESRRYNETPR